MNILLNNDSLTKSLRPFKDIGFVPTMGSIHKGHISLIKKSIKLCKKTLVSIFVNPKQFNNKKDFKSYPTNLKKDLSLLKKIKKIDFVYIPNFTDIYNSKRDKKITINKKDNILCAKYRKGHFEGVLDVMDRFTSQIKPKKIFLGEKDYQQLYLVKKYIQKRYSAKIISCKTVRDINKLALSSRNYLLNKRELKLAATITNKLFLLKRRVKSKKNINKFLSKQKKLLKQKFNIKIDYLECRNEKNLLMTNKFYKSRLFIAYYINNIRLIDNM
tara:strand:+ start:43 stop:858 length:816 start_codon:yes stop_codon:yes gene_type:complete